MVPAEAGQACAVALPVSLLSLAWHRLWHGDQYVLSLDDETLLMQSSAPFSGLTLSRSAARWAALILEQSSHLSSSHAGVPACVHAMVLLPRLKLEPFPAQASPLDGQDADVAAQKSAEAAKAAEEFEASVLFLLCSTP